MSQGLKVGDAVALNLENCPDFAAIWFGLAKIGVAPALINTNLEGDGLAHCIGIVDAKAVIAGGEQTARVKVSLAKNGAKLPIWDLDGNHGQNLSLALKGRKALRPDPASRQHLRGKDVALYHIHIGNDRAAQSRQDHPYEDSRYGQDGTGVGADQFGRPGL